MATERTLTAESIDKLQKILVEQFKHDQIRRFEVIHLAPNVMEFTFTDSAITYHDRKALCGTVQADNQYWSTKRLREEFLDFEEFQAMLKTFPHEEHRFCKDCLNHDDYALMVLANV